MMRIFTITIIVIFCSFRLFAPEVEHTFTVTLPEVVITAKSVVSLERLTVYNPVKGQTDSTPDRTSIGAKIDTHNPLKHRWIALSQDLLKEYPYGSYVLISGTGIYDGKWRVMDCMNARYKNSADVLTHHKTGRWLDGKAKLERA